MRDHLTAEDLDRVLFRAQDEDGRWVNVSAKVATDQQFHKWATGRAIFEGENGQWKPEDRAGFCDVLYQHGRIHLLKKEVASEPTNT